MVQFSCGDVHLGCDALFVAGSGEEVLRQVTRHSWESHGLAAPHLPTLVVNAVLAGLTMMPVRRPIALVPALSDLADVSDVSDISDVSDGANASDVVDVSTHAGASVGR